MSPTVNLLGKWGKLLLFRSWKICLKFPQVKHISNQSFIAIGRPLWTKKLQQGTPSIYWGVVLGVLLSVLTWTLTFVNMGFPCKVATTHWSQSIVMLVLWKDSLGCRNSYRRSVTPPSKILRKYRGISVRPIPRKKIKCKIVNKLIIENLLTLIRRVESRKFL